MTVKIFICVIFICVIFYFLSFVLFYALFCVLFCFVLFVFMHLLYIHYVSNLGTYFYNISLIDSNSSILLYIFHSFIHFSF